MLKTTVSAFALAAALAAAGLPSANAMTFSRFSYSAPSHNVRIDLSGEIQAGDADKLAAFLQTLPATDHIGAFGLSSPGGNVWEAFKLSEIIAQSGASTVLFDNGVCASACFWMFVAGQPRVMSASAQLGVHMPQNTITGKEADSLGIAMARLGRQSHLPDSIIVKMLTTTPDDMAFLTPLELTQMGVKIVPPSQQTALALPPPPTYTPAPAAPAAPPTYAPAPTPLSPPTPAAVDPTQAFEQGQTERRAFEDWIASLPEGNQFKDGALYWASVRSTKKAAIAASVPVTPASPRKRSGRPAV